MTKDSAVSFSGLLSSRAVVATKGTNHDIYDKRLKLPHPWQPFQYVPRCVYFFYVRLDTDGKIRVDHYFYNDGPDPLHPAQWAPIPYTAMDVIVRHLALNARSTGAKNPAPLPDHNFENIRFTRRSYVAIFVDEADWVFHKNAAGRAAIAFNPAKGSAPNHSFFDADDLEIRMPVRGGGEDTRTAVYMINHLRKNANGDELGDMGKIEEEYFAFDMYFAVNFADPSATPMTVILDPGGTNVGPPEQP